MSFDICTAEQAHKILSCIQTKNKPVTKRLCGAKVSVMPLDGNVFEITLDLAVHNASKAADRLNDVGANIQPFRKPWAKTGIVKAVATWDTALHYLVMTGDLA